MRLHVGTLCGLPLATAGHRRGWHDENGSSQAPDAAHSAGRNTHLNNRDDSGPPAGRSNQAIWGALLFVAGLVLAAVFALGISWPDQEAVNFERSLAESEALSALRCPLLITPQDNGEIGVTITNTHIRPTSLRIRARVSLGTISSAREDIQQVALEPDESATLRWPIAMEDAVYGRIVMARVNQFRRTPFPAQSSACGVLVLNVPGLTGGQIVALLVSGALLGLAGGAALWLRAGWPLNLKRRGTAQRAALILILVVLSVVAGLLHATTVGLLLLLFSTIVIGSLVEQLR